MDAKLCLVEHYEGVGIHDIDIRDGREASKRLVEHYEGVGIHAIDIREADEVIRSLFYAGVKPPYMWWAEFEKRLTRAWKRWTRSRRSVPFPANPYGQSYDYVDGWFASVVSCLAQFSTACLHKNESGGQG
jgi:hypothetical protein